MSRPLRLEYAGAVWHVTSRGNERKEVFRDDGDRTKFLSILGRTVNLFGWDIHAYVLMGNHYHLLLETPQPSLSRGMRQLNGVYTQAFNRRHKRVGHLFQGRFTSILVEKDSHLLELVRYVVLNPVRAAMVRSARDWPWSSYRATAGFMKPPDWMSVDWTLRQFGTNRTQAGERYRAFVSDGNGAGYDPWGGVRGQIYLGTDDFIKEAREKIRGKRVGRGVPWQQREPYQVDAVRAAADCARSLGAGIEELNAHPRQRATERALIAFALKRYARSKLLEIAAVLQVGEGRASAMALVGEELALRLPRLGRALKMAFEK